MKLENGNVIMGDISIPIQDLEMFGENILVAKVGDELIPEENCTAGEQEVFNAWRELYPNGKPRPPIEPQIIQEPIDEEKVAMAEAIIDLEMRLLTVESKLGG